MAAARAAGILPDIMKWFYGGLALALGALVAGLASIVVGYRQVISSYVGDQKATAESARQPQANRRR